MISQLPADDRKNFEYGNVTFYQNHAHKLGLGLFSDKTELPKGEELLVRIERGGVTTAYEIDFNAGAIRSIPQWQAQPGSSRKANIVSETKVFTPAPVKPRLIQSRHRLAIHPAIPSPRPASN